MYCQTSSSVQFEIGKARMFSPLWHAGVEQVPQLGALVLRVPAAEFVAEGKDALLGAGLFLVAAGAADAGVEAELLDGFEQRHRLVLVARLVGRLEHAPCRAPSSSSTERTIRRSPSSQARASRKSMTSGSCGRCRCAAAGRESARAEGLLGQAQEHDGILAAGEQQGRVAALAGHFAQDVDGLGFEPVEVVEGILCSRLRIEDGAFMPPPFRATEGSRQRRLLQRLARCAPALPSTRCSPHSLVSALSHHQRPARTSSPGWMARVQGAQPMLG
jgi:hypothetical protein